MELKTRAYSMLVFSMLLASLLPILLSFGKGAVLDEFLLIVYASSIPFAFLAVYFRGKTGELRAVLKKPRTLAIMAVTGIASIFPIQYGVAFAESQVSASLAIVIIRTSPLLMLLLLPIMLRERLTKYQIFALSLGFVGLYIGVTGGSLTVFQNADTGMVMFLIAMAFIYAFCIVLLKKYMFDVSVFVFVSGIVMFILMSGIFAAGGAQLYPLTAFQISLAILIGIFYNVFNNSIYYYALRPVKATVVANIFAISPFITFLLASVILGEPIQVYYVAIALLAFAGIVIQSFDKYGSSYIAKRKSSISDRMVIFDVTGVFANTGEMAINDTIQNGGRILAVKLPNEYSGQVSGMADMQTQVYTDSHKSIAEESRFVKDIVGAGKDEFVVMKAGLLEECEQFFEKLQERMKMPGKEEGEPEAS